MAPRKEPNPVDTHVGVRLKQRRAMIGLTQEKLGEQLGVTFQQIQKYEKGANRIGASRLQEIAQILDVPVSYFFDDTDLINGLGRAPASVAQGYGFGDAPQQALNDYVGVANPTFGHAAASDTHALAKAFSQISDARVRRRIIDLVETLADTRDR